MAGASTLEWPTGLDAHVIDGRLEVTFVRHLVTPADLANREVEVAFYESTYFYAFHVTNPPRTIGGQGRCSARVHPFDPDEQTMDLQATLVELGREETPGIANVGALFADRIVLQCA